MAYTTPKRFNYDKKILIKLKSYFCLSIDNLHYEKIGKETRCIEDEILFEIPNNWTWVRLGEIGEFFMGGTPSKGVIQYWGDEIKWLTIGDYAQFDTIYNTATKITNLGLKNSSAKLIEAGCVVVSIYATIGRVGILGCDMATNQAIVSIKPFQIYNRYLMYAIDSTKGVMLKSANKTTQKNINLEILKHLLIPLPPLQEQKRIVDKLKEILPLVEKYKEDKEKLDELNLNFPSKLKKSILDYAIKGKLVEQNLEYESVEILLQNIRQEKQKLIKDKKIKADKFLQSTIFIGEDNSPYEKIGKISRCIKDEIPFEIPKNWAWVRFGSYVKYDIGKTPLRKEEEFWIDARYPWITIADMVADGKIYSTKDKINNLALKVHFKNELIPVGTLIMSFKLTVGRVSILDIEAVHNEAIISIYPFIDNDKIATNFLFKFLPLLSEQGKTKKAIKGNTLNSDSLNNILLPLPPLQEQKRIVAKIEELLKFVDDLQGSLK